MDENRIKNSVDWFYQTVYRDLLLSRREETPEVPLPPLLQAARSLENRAENPWQTRESLFLKQGKLLADFEDDYEYSGNVVRYFPTYESLDNCQLRGYFTWRKRARKGDYSGAPRSFVFLYIYELLNQIGVSTPMEGFEKLTALQGASLDEQEMIPLYLEEWIPHYVAYYNLDASLLQQTEQVQVDRCIAILDTIEHQSVPDVMAALRQLAPGWLSRSKFFAQHPEDAETIIVRSLRRISAHYATRTKTPMVDRFFGPCDTFPVTLFTSAVFCNPLKIRNARYVVDERRIYQCKNGFWTVTRHGFAQRPCSHLEEILKTIDAVMREEYHFKYKLKNKLETKWLQKIIYEEVQALLAEKKAAEAKKISIDYSQLSKIRQQAVITQEKLTVEEEAEAPPELPATPPCVPAADSPLSENEYRLLQGLLYGRSNAWVQAEGHLLSVLIDGINEKLYDTFLDTVVDDTPAVIEDYIDDLKEMVAP